MRNALSVFLLGFLFFGGMIAAQAAEVANTQVANTVAQSTTANSTTVGTASDWGLSAAEWARYQSLMQGKNGLWYPKLTPPEVLGLNAADNTEQAHFADLVAAEEHDKLARELAFDRAVHQASLKRYADEPIIQPNPNLAAFSPRPALARPTAALADGDRLAFFTAIASTPEPALPRLLEVIKNHPNVGLDIYCVGNANDAAIAAWAKANGIPADLVNARRVTLNRDNGALQKTAPGVSAPYLLKVSHGMSQSITVGSLA
jgi:integrating conjugative element protein (TIGR03759 family)